MKIAYLVPYTPSQIRPRPFRFLKTLARNENHITLFTVWTDQSEIAALEELKSFGIRIVATHLTRARALWNSLRALPGRVPLQACYSWEPALAAHWAQAVRDSNFDILHVEHLRGARYGLHIRNVLANASPRIVWDSVDCISGLFSRASTQSVSAGHRLITRIEYPRTRAYEAKLIRTFDETIVVSETERRSLMDLPTDMPHPNPESHIHIVPTGVDVDYFARAQKAHDANTIVFTGKMSYHANIAAAHFLLNDIMPRVWAHEPDAQVLIVGADPPAALKRTAAARHDRVTVTDTVPDVRPYLEHATVAAAPIVYGAGIQVKILEALAMQTPVVTTDTAAAALNAQSERDMLVAADADEFAKQILRVLHTPALQAALKQNGRAFVEKFFSIQACTDKLCRVYDQTVHTHKGA